MSEGTHPTQVARCVLPALITEARFKQGENYLFAEDADGVIVFHPQLDYLDRRAKNFTPAVKLSRIDFQALFCRTGLSREMYEL